MIANGVVVSDNSKSRTLTDLPLGTKGYDQNWASTNGRWDLYWNSSWANQAKAQKATTALDNAHSFLVSTWGLLDPVTDGGDGWEPPVEVYVLEQSGYNGWAEWYIGIDQRFAIGIRPDYLDFDISHEPLKVAGHELLHLVQARHPGPELPDWVSEGQARMTQDKLNDWLDHADGTEAGSSFLRQSNSYLTGSHTSDLTSISYDACLFWAYALEQVGTDHTDPDYGYDVIADFWDTSVNPESTDGISMFNSMLAHKGAGTSFQEIFEDFSVANYAKDLTDGTVPAAWKYVDDDETDGSGDYDAVSKQISGDTISSVNSESDSYETINRWASKYYEVDLDSSARVITVQFNQTTENTLFYAMLLMKGDDLAYSYTVESKHFQRAIVNDNYDKMVIIVVGLENEEASPAVFEYLIEGGSPELSILQPRNSPETWQARAGTHDNPEKFLAIVDIYQRQAAPVHGFATDNFRATVGGIEAPVLSAIDVYGKYFLEIQAPNQSADGLYTLAVSLVDSDGSTVLTSDSNANSVYYGERYIDNSLVIDRSGSMATKGKIDAAKSAAKLYVNSYLSKDQMAVISYSSTATVEHILQELTPGNRSNAITKINSISTGGTTSIGDGLLKGQNELYLRGIFNYSKEIILLSDGLENTAPMIAQILPLLLANGTIVHVITIGATENSNSELMQELAGDTGGTYHHAFDPASGDIPNDLADIYRDIVNTIRNLQRFYRARGTIGSFRSFDVPVTNDLTELEVTVHFNSTATPSITLQNPSGGIITPTYTNIVSGMGHNFYRISGAIATGNWKVNITPGASLAYFIEGAGKSDVTLRLLTPPNGAVSPVWAQSMLTGNPQQFVISLSDSKPITNANVIVNITHPEKAKNKIWSLPLYDDGGHGDGSANDGIYGNEFTGTITNGTYSFIVSATGTSNDYGAFNRMKSGAFHVYAEREQGMGDWDYDTLPDVWETHFGLSSKDGSGENGPNGDPDKDGLKNSDEFFHGTNPMDSDTDNGGEGDGSEVTFNRNPLNPVDDVLGKMAPIRVYPGNGQVSFKLPNTTAYLWLYVFRSTSPVFGYTQIFGDYYPTSSLMYVDSGVSNYNTYYYRFYGATVSGQKTGLTREYSAIPKLKVIAPEGCVELNGGNRTTTALKVQVEIWHVETDCTNETTFDPVEMRFGETYKELESKSWVPFDTEFEYLFNDLTQGLKILYVQLRDNQTIPEVSPVFTAGIIFDLNDIGIETSVTLLLILIDILVITIIYIKRKKFDFRIANPHSSTF